MDFKGLTWAGNIYQKFEAMCLEVEEVMYEDTVKYVENQAQKVGGSVKKFYSEVMQDLVSLSCVDSVKVAESNKPKPVMLDSLEELRKKETKDEDNYDLAEEKSSSRFCNDANHLSPSSDVDPTKTRTVGAYKRPIANHLSPPSSDVGPTKSRKVGAYKRPIGIKRISRNNNPPEVTCHVTSLSRDTTSNHLMASDDMSVTSSSEFSVRHHPVEAVNVNISEASDEILLAESVMQEKHDCEYVFLRQKKNGSQCPSSCHGLTIKPTDKFKKDGSLNIGSNACDDDSAIEEVISCYEDNFDMEIIDNEEAVDANLEPIENSKLEETCILVQGDELHFVSQGTEKHKSYKKKIREALSSKLMSARKVIPALTVESDKTKYPFHDSFESDWELL